LSQGYKNKKPTNKQTNEKRKKKKELRRSGGCERRKKEPAGHLMAFYGAQSNWL